MNTSSVGPTGFYFLPELLYEVFKHVERKAHLAQCCLISKTYYQYAVPWLYEWIYVYTWHKGAKQKVWMILETLATSPHLASHVKLLDFRDFPTHLNFDERHRLIALAVQALSNCVNLRSCTWTRDGSLSTRILQQLAGIESLRELEINARPGAFGAWLPEDLLAFQRLQSLTLIMPARSVVEILPAWIAKNVNTLESLVIICKSTPLVNDDALQCMLPSMRNLRRFHIAGCIRVTETSVNNILAENHNLLSLALESCSPNFDMGAFATTCAQFRRLSSLTSISLTIPVFKDSNQRQSWLNQVLLLLEHSPLELFQLYAGGGTEDSISYVGIDDEVMKRFVDSHASTLKRVGIQRLIVPLESLAYACERCSRLEEIFITLCNVDRDALARTFAKGKHLRNVHLTLMTEVAGKMRPLHLHIAQDVCLHVARNCGESLRLVGSQTRVWEVQRRFFNERTIISLGAYSGHRIPEQFLMMRT